MSATGRGTTRDEKDFYATPRAAFEPLLKYLPVHVQYWEPCAGDGRLIQWLFESGRKADGADLYPKRVGDVTPLPSIDYLTDYTERDFVLTNPPFSLAFEMAKQARTHSNEFMFLLRLSFLESEERAEWLSANEPSALFVLKKRPSFVMSVTCKTSRPVTGGTCKHNWILPVESERPKACPVCGGKNLAISTSDNSGYAWYYWGSRFEGIRHI